MRIACIIGSDPRFIKDFDLQLDSFKDCVVDWYMALWQKNYTGDNTLDKRSNLIPNFFKTNPSQESAFEFIQSKLPLTHRLKKLELVNYDATIFKVDHFQKLHNAEGPLNWLSRAYIWNKACSLLENNVGNYPLIFLTRPDIKIEPTVNPESLIQHLNSDQNNVISQEQPHKLFYHDVWFASNFQNIEKICSIDKYIDHFNITLGHEFDPEKITFNIIKHLGINYVESELRSVVRSCGQYTNEFPGLNFKPDFGRWQ